MRLLNLVQSGFQQKYKKIYNILTKIRDHLSYEKHKKFKKHMSRILFAVAASAVLSAPAFCAQNEYENTFEISESCQPSANMLEFLENSEKNLRNQSLVQVLLQGSPKDTPIMVIHENFFDGNPHVKSIKASVKYVSIRCANNLKSNDIYLKDKKDVRFTQESLAKLVSYFNAKKQMIDSVEPGLIMPLIVSSIPQNTLQL